MKLGELKPPEGSRKKEKACWKRTLVPVTERRRARVRKGRRPVQEVAIRPDLRAGRCPFNGVCPKGDFSPLSKKRVCHHSRRDLNRFPKDSVVEPELLLQTGLLARRGTRSSFSSDGELAAPITIRVHQLSQSRSDKS